MSRLFIIAIVLVAAGCELLPGRDDFTNEARISNETDETVVIYWSDSAGDEERIFELGPYAARRRDRLTRVRPAWANRGHDLW